MTTGRVPIPVDQTTIPYGMDRFSPVALSLVEISLSVTFTTIDPVFRSMPSLWNFSSAKAVILLSNLHSESNRKPETKLSNKILVFHCAREEKRKDPQKGKKEKRIAATLVHDYIPDLSCTNCRDMRHMNKLSSY